jgi:hypothetical protein
LNYTLFDLIQKLIDIENDFYNIYVKIEEQSKNKTSAIYAVTKAIEKQVKKQIEYFEEIKNDSSEKSDEFIDIYIYDKIAKLLFEFRTHIMFPEINTVQDLIKYAVEFKKNTIGLLLDMQGRLLEKMEDVNNDIYKILSIIIKEEEKNEKMFKNLLMSK